MADLVACCGTSADRVVAVILAGGQARRFGGGDKSLLEVGGRSILARVIAALATDVAAIAISANGDPSRFAGFGLPVVADAAFAGEGPLAGLLAGLDWAAGQGADSVLTVPGDTPFIPRGLPRVLAPAPACASSNGWLHYLVALWPVACRQALRDWLQGGGGASALGSRPPSRAASRGVRHFAASLGMRRVDFAACPWDPFLNVNTADDLAAARALAARVDAGGAG